MKNQELRAFRVTQRAVLTILLLTSCLSGILQAQEGGAALIRTCDYVAFLDETPEPTLVEAGMGDQISRNGLPGLYHYSVLRGHGSEDVMRGLSRCDVEAYCAWKKSVTGFDLTEVSRGESDDLLRSNIITHSLSLVPAATALQTGGSAPAELSFFLAWFIEGGSLLLGPGLRKGARERALNIPSNHEEKEQYPFFQKKRRVLPSTTRRLQWQRAITAGNPEFFSLLHDAHEKLGKMFLENGDSDRGELEKLSMSIHGVPPRHTFTDFFDEKEEFIQAAQEDEAFWLDRQEWLLEKEKEFHAQPWDHEAREAILKEVEALIPDAREAEEDWIAASQQDRRCGVRLLISNLLKENL